MSPEATTPDALARACAAAMWAQDRASHHLGMALGAVAADAATLTMVVTDDMANGHGICHGGCVFALANSAMAFAANTADQRAVARHAAITYLRPAQRGDSLSATAVLRRRAGRSAIWDVTVATASGTVVAEFRGETRAIAGTLLPAPSPG